MSYVSLTLKYRPRRFEEIVGQPHVSQTLMNAVESDRVAHAYLFSGPRGTGKTSTARVLAKALNCEQGMTPTPCDECSVCASIRDGNALDVIEIDAASNRGIDEVRELRERVKYRPATCRCKIYILDEAHMLTREAANALLKTLEEPPEHAFFVLATTEAHKLPPTILSRCQRFDFRNISSVDITAALADIVKQEGVEADDAALAAIARAARGAMRDAQSILDQVIAYTEGRLTLEVVNEVLGATGDELVTEVADIVLRRDVAAAFEAVDRLIKDGKDIGQLLLDLTTYFRNLLLLSLGGSPEELVEATELEREKLTTHASEAKPARVMAAIDVLTATQNELRQSSQHRIALELALARICRHEDAAPEPPRQPAAKKQAAPRREAAAPPPAPPGEEPAVAVGDGPLELATITSNWTAAQAGLSASIRACLLDATPIAFEDGVLTLQFTKQFHHDQINSQYSVAVQQALSQALKHDVKLKCVVETGEEPAPAPPRQQSLMDAGTATEPEAAPPKQHTAAGDQAASIDDVMDLFGGAPVDDDQ
ncbi:MAG: DNA polymerase III subunit gamma/tau [Armatimonadota bacterium]